MNKYPEDGNDWLELASIHAEPWMIEALKFNSGYIEWASNQEQITIADIDYLSRLDDSNECAHFYFDIHRDSKPCESCNVDSRTYAGTSPEVRQLWDALTFGDKTLTKEDIDSLWSAPQKGEVPKPKADEVNEFNRNTPAGTAYDHPFKWASNWYNVYLVARGRAKALGLPLECPECEGEADIFIGPPKLQLHLWWLYPRHCGSGEVVVDNIHKEDMPLVLAWLEEAARRNAAKFVNILNPPASE